LATNTPHAETLVVDDLDEFRNFLCTTLQEKTQCKVVGEASDGLQAVQQAEKLQPELILLDVGLPTMNGLQAARRIRELSPNSKILFVSQNASPEIAQRAIELGAYGYLLKSDTSDLALAVEAVLGGEQFVSSRLRVP
jgi:DNA-binding NarL/FixJ family response regulator